MTDPTTKPRPSCCCISLIGQLRLWLYTEGTVALCANTCYCNFAHVSHTQSNL